ncbi:MAG TPA: hypothetical protein DCP51_05780 [Clostridiales bacterium]|nr:hypothetical protein [Clostridiales bacterium]
MLNDVDFRINKGDKVAIVGISGIGKSTIINLILKLYKIKNGDILINNINITELNSTSIRENFSVVSQDIMLFDDTIRVNLLAGRDKTDSEIYETLKKVGLYEKITELPDGLDTELSGGFDLSGGQKQRLMIARAILKNADTIILDEATSALDVNTEKIVLNNLFNNQNDKTIILISHRLATVSVCDKVIVINDGSVEYAGDMKNAIKKSSKFKELFGTIT